MNPQPQFDDSQSVSKIVGNIVADVQTLMRQEVALAKTEIRQTWADGKKAAVGLVLAGGALGLGAVLLTLCLVRAVEAAGLPLWASYGLFALLYLVGGIAYLSVVRKRAKDIRPVPRETLETLQENIQWLKRQK